MQFRTACSWKWLSDCYVSLPCSGSRYPTISTSVSTSLQLFAASYSCLGSLKRNNFSIPEIGQVRLSNHPARWNELQHPYNKAKSLDITGLDTGDGLVSWRERDNRAKAGGATFELWSRRSCDQAWLVEGTREQWYQRPRQGCRSRVQRGGPSTTTTVNIYPPSIYSLWKVRVKPREGRIESRAYTRGLRGVSYATVTVILILAGRE